MDKMTTEDEANSNLEEMSLEEIVKALENGDLTLEDLRESEEVRERINRMIVKRDMEEHSEIYTRLAEV